MNQKILFGNEAREQLLIGINLATDVVKCTLGPKGKNVIRHVIDGGVSTTKDGISALNEVRPDNQLHNAGVKVIRHAVQKTADEAGDATTSTAILACAMCNEANDRLKAGARAVDLRKEIEWSVIRAVEWIEENSISINGDVEKIRAVATISANNNKAIGDLIADAFMQIGEDGVITPEASQSSTSSIEVLGGYHLNRGMVSPYFITNEIKGECVLVDPFILLYDKRISKVEDLLTVLQYVIGDGKNPRSLLIIAATCEQAALGTLIANKLKHGLKVCVVFAPEQGVKRLDIMQDIAIFTGGQVISEDQGTSLDRENFKPEFLGTAAKVIVKRDSCVIVNGQGDPDLAEIRQKQIKEMITEAPSDFEKNYLRRRAGSIGRGVAVLSIGAATQLERGDLMDLAEDAVLATRAAIEEGFLPGGGVGFIRIAEHLYNTFEKTTILEDALYEPLKQIISNNGLVDDSGKILMRVVASDLDYGYNAKTGEFGYLIAEGVIDPAKAIRCAIENAASVAAMFLSTDVLVSEVEEGFVEQKTTAEISHWDAVWLVFTLAALVLFIAWFSFKIAKL